MEFCEFPCIIPLYLYTVDFAIWAGKGRYIDFKIYVPTFAHKKMVYNRYKCHPAIKALCTNHGSCCRLRHGQFTATGHELVQYGMCKGGLLLPCTLNLPEGFTLEGEYPVCKTMHSLLSRTDSEKIGECYTVKSTGSKYSRQTVPGGG